MEGMNSIHYENDLFSAETFGVPLAAPGDIPSADGFAVKAGQGVSLAIATRDEVPLVFAGKGILGVAKVGLKEAVDETVLKKFHACITQYDLDPASIQVYLGPSLTFSHTHVDRPLIVNLMDRGYRACCKRTDGVDFLDVPLLVLMQCRHLGIPMANIHIGDYDTFENPQLLYSTLRGDEKDNVTVATLK